MTISIDFLKAILVAYRCRKIVINKLIHGAGDAAFGRNDIRVDLDFLTLREKAPIQVEAKGIHLSGRFPLQHHIFCLKCGSKGDEGDGSIHHWREQSWGQQTEHQEEDEESEFQAIEIALQKTYDHA